MKKTLSFSRNPRPWRTNPKIHGFPDFQGGVRNLDLSSKGFWSRGWRPRVKLVHPHTSPYSCSSPRSTRVQSRDTSGSSFWFIQISSLVASLMNSTRFLRCRMRFTEFVCKRKVGKTFNSNIILLWFTLIKLYNNICMCGPLFQNLAVSSLEVAHNLNISQVFISQVYVPPPYPTPEPSLLTSPSFPSLKCTWKTGFPLTLRNAYLMDKNWTKSPKDAQISIFFN